MIGVAGLDASTKSFGVATGSGQLVTIRPRAGAAEAGRRLHELVAGTVQALRAFPPAPILAVVEGPADYSPGIRSTIALAKVRGAIELRCFELGISYLEIPPKRLKLYATGNGAAKKEAMIAAATVDGACPLNDDEADAYWLRHLGRFALGLEPAPADPELEKHRLEIAAAYNWPTVAELQIAAPPTPPTLRRRSHT